jgi:transforming growth factor-beta-induced protein
VSHRPPPAAPPVPSPLSSPRFGAGRARPAARRVTQPTIPSRKARTVQRKLLWKVLTGLFLALALTTAACSDDGDDAATGNSAEPSPSSTAPADAGEGSGAAASSEVCDTDAIVQAVEGGADEGTLAGMTDDPVATAASNNPVLTTLTTAVGEAGLVDTLNSAEALTVFAPTDCAFSQLDPATLEAAMADPTGLLAQVLGFHVIPGERLSAADLATAQSLETFTGAALSVSPDGDTVALNGGQADIVVPDIQTANATVHLIDNVMVPADDMMAP